jgi:hypothetical protein
MHITFENQLELVYLDLREMHEVAAEGVRAIDTADGVRGSRIALRAIMRRIETMIAAGQQAERGRQAARAELRALSARLRGT